MALISHCLLVILGLTVVTEQVAMRPDIEGNFYDACQDYQVSCDRMNLTCVQLSSDGAACVCDLEKKNCIAPKLQPGQNEIPDGLEPKLPQVTDVFPTYGPQAGGTNLTISGTNLTLNQRVSVLIGSHRCQNVSVLVTRLYCVTPAYGDRNALVKPPNSAPGARLPVHLVYPESQILLKAKKRFRYLEDPTIEDFYPKDSIVGGGISLTVTGKSLTSVVLHVMKVTMLYKRLDEATNTHMIISTRIFTSTCTVQSDTMMSCPTPDIELPGPFANLTATAPSADTQKQPNRAKREENGDDQTVVSELDDESLEFYVSFRSDGVTTFDSFSEKNAITIYANPSFEQFTETILKYDPNNVNPSIRIRGQHLLSGLRVGDYYVAIGVGNCSNVQVTSNELVCLPPGKEPATDVTALGEAKHVDGAPSVMVFAGYTPYFIGHLDYTGERGTSAATGLFLTGGGLLLSLHVFTFMML